MSYDVREIANFVIELGHKHGMEVTNGSVNKIVYFLHGWHLAKTGTPLVSARIEAWQYGPVFRELYREFKALKEEPIRHKATRIDPLTGTAVECEPNIPDSINEFLTDLALKYLQIPFSRLVSMSHETGGPWDVVWNYEDTPVPGLKISDTLIQKHFAEKVRH